MSRRALAASLAALALLMATTLLGRRGAAGAGSTLSPGAAGWAAARGYLERRGAAVELVDVPDPEPGAGVLVIALPWQHHGLDSPAELAGRHLAAGGTLVAAFAGSAFSPGEVELAHEVGLDVAETRGDPPLDPRGWRAYVREKWTLASDPPGGAAVTIGAPRRFPQAPPDARVSWRGPDGRPMIFSFAHGAGTVLVLPADALSNGRLAADGNVELLEWLRATLGDRWAFDEFHHGLVAASAAAGTTPSSRAMDAFLLQLALVYVLALFAASRRFGPAWSEPPVVAGSTAAFLVGLGAVHDRLGHHAEAARLLVRRAAELDPRLESWAAGRSTRQPRGREGLLSTAREVAAAQARPGGGR